ncbi:MAG: DUF3783 domain-containing protein [Roseburia sp.]
MEKILAFHLDETKKKQLLQAAAILKIRCEFIPDEWYLQTIDALLAKQHNPEILPFTGDAPKETLILLCDFSERHMHELLSSLRKKHLIIDYKAVLTPTNRTWNVLELLEEMRKEKEAYQTASKKPSE